MNEFQNELQSLINRYSRENYSDTPDYILAEYLQACLIAFEQASRQRDVWHEFEPFKGITR